MADREHAQAWMDGFWYSGKVTRRRLIGYGAGVLGATMLVPAPWRSAFGQAKEIRIAHVYDKTGPLEAYAKQTHAGLMMGLEYATGGKMEVLGRKIVVIEKDSQTKPDVGKAQLAAAFGDDKVDLAIGPTSSGVALAMLPVAISPIVIDAATHTADSGRSGGPTPRTLFFRATNAAMAAKKTTTKHVWNVQVKLIHCSTGQRRATSAIAKSLRM